MPELTRVQFTFEAESMPGLPVTVLGVEAEEALGRPYRASIELAVEDLDAELGALLGDNGVLTFSRGSFERRLCGVIERVDETVEYEAGPEQAQLARVTLSPALALGRHVVNTRMFQEKTVPEILEAVLGDALGPYGREAVIELDGEYDPREYCLMYRESNLDFVHRLMAEEGIAYAFDHEGAVEVVRFTDRNAAFAHVPTAAGDGIAHFDPHQQVVREHEPVHDFELSLSETTTAITLRDADFTIPDHVVEAPAEGEDASGRVRERYEHGEAVSIRIGSYDEGVRRYQKNDADRQAALRKEVAVARARVGHGRGAMIAMTPGATFTLSGHPAVGVDADYLVTRVSHRSAADEPETDGGVDDAYSNSFECVPLETPWRPHRPAPRPRIHGVQPAIVTGPGGEEIHVDGHGRIKVQFHWDRENPADETSSCWIRVKQEWAGASWGFWWVPRIGMEVVVEFIDGDPDRPLVTGCVFNGPNPTPYPLPDDKTKSTIKSDSSLGGGGFNELRFEDAAGQEEIFTHAQKDYDEVVENDHSTLVHHDQTNTVGNDQTQTIDVDQTERVDVDQTMTVGGNRTVHVKGNYDETVDGTETRQVGGDVTETFAATETRTIAANVTESIGGDETRDIGADQSETIGASHAIDVGADSTLDVGAALTRTATAGINTTTPASQEISVAGAWTVTAPGGIHWTAPAGVTLTMPAGISRADAFWQLVCGMSQEQAKTEIEFFITKFGLAGLVFGTWIFKMDLHAHSRAANLAELAAEGAKARNGLSDDEKVPIQLQFKALFAKA